MDRFMGEMGIPQNSAADREELDQAGWSAADLAARPKGDGRKVQIARRLWMETTMTLKWMPLLRRWRHRTKPHGPAS